MGFVFRKPFSATQRLKLELKIIGAKFKELWEYNLLITGADVAAILAGTYISKGTDGEGETNGVPTDSDISSILAGSYLHKDYEIDDYAPDSTISDDDIEKILAGSY